VNDSDLRAQLSLALGGAYVLERELETAGRSRLFLAREVYHDRDVVVKVLPPEVSEGVVMERFEREIHFIGALQEPHTVPVLSTGATVSGHLFYTMPYIAEPSLGRRLEAGPISFDDSIIALRDVARAMAHAHRQNIVHGDIQPEKVFLLKGVAVVTDFGVASALEASRRVEERRSLRLVRTSVATPAYTAPEHAAASPESDHRADIYAWGVMAYELLYDQHPFPNVATEADLLEAHTSAPPPVPPHKQFGIPEQLAGLVMRCIAKNPDERPNDAAELLAVVERIPSGAAALAIESWSTYRLIGFTMVAFALFLALAAMIWRVQAVSVDEPTLVAVLPMENSGSTADTVFSEAIEYGVIAKLARLPSIRLVDVGSVHAVADGRDAWETGKALGAQYVLRTGLRWFRDFDGASRAQVSPALLQVSDGTVKWAGEPAPAFPADPFTTQTSLATMAARELGVDIRAGEKAIFAERGTNDTLALRAYTRGEEIYWRGATFLPDIPHAALDEFERAYRADPRYGDAHAGAAAMLAREGRTHATPTVFDSATRSARRALAVSPNNSRALTAAGTIALLRNRPDDALTLVGRALENNGSDVEALQLRCELLLLVGDSSAVWRDIERIIRLAPRSPNALIGAAVSAAALRRFSDANEFLHRARAIMPKRPDLVLRAAHIARNQGDLAAMIRLMHEFVALGGSPSAEDLVLLRSGDREMQQALAAGAPETFHAASAADSLHYYLEKAQLNMARRDAPTARALLDSAANVLKELLGDLATSGSERRVFSELMAWTEAARGERGMALAGVNDVPQSLQRWPRGSWSAYVACNDAQIYALLGEVEKMLPPLERCLTLPGGFSTSAIAAEPALARHARDPRVRAMLGRAGLDTVER